MMKINVILMIFSLLQINITSQTVRKDFEIDTFETMEIGDTVAIKQDGYIEVDSNQNYEASTAETVCLLSKLHEVKHHVNVTLDMGELDITSAESKVTYEEIKDYVLEKHGLQVTNLYIAQVKRKCGIIERENYNKSQKEDAKQSQCPEDKEKAIRDALEYFGMV